MDLPSPNFRQHLNTSGVPITWGRQTVPVSGKNRMHVTYQQLVAKRMGGGKEAVYMSKLTCWVSHCTSAERLLRGWERPTDRYAPGEVNCCPHQPNPGAQSLKRERWSSPASRRPDCRDLVCFCRNTASDDKHLPFSRLWHTGVSLMYNSHCADT